MKVNDEKQPDTPFAAISSSAAERENDAERMSIPDRALLILARLLDRPGTPEEFERKRQFAIAQIREAVEAERDACIDIAASFAVFSPIEAQERAASIVNAIRARKT